ncbi:hypothetical protein F5Y04DRAFT_286997 [Hypomontagnella monticulosa]|nr:hypothetical protein F5Y04DRAFT_286997 [Hypomontagnella monticulosa]
MGGIELIGVIIGAIPLVIEAYDHSDSAVRGISTLSKESFVGELRRLQSRFRTQRAIFRVTASSLHNVMENDENRVMERLSSHLSWEVGSQGVLKEDHEDNQLDSLNELLESCQEALQQILEDLGCITATLEKFQADQSKIQQDVKTDLGARLKFTWERSGIDQRIQKFRELNKDFVEMGNEIIKIFRDRNTTSEPVTKKALGYSDTSHRLGSYRRIQHASLELYKTISERWHCGIHERHIVHICSPQGLERYPVDGLATFRVVIASSNSGSEPPCNLELEVEHCRCNETTDSGSPKPTVKPQDMSGIQTSSGSGLLSQNPTVNHLISSLQKGSWGWVPDTKQGDHRKLRRRPKFTHIHSNIPLEKLALTSTSTENDKAEGRQSLPFDTQGDLRCISDHCNHFWERRGVCSERICLGYLAGQCLEQFFVQPAGIDGNKSSISLAYLIRSASGNQLISSLSRQLTMSLARSIADVVLHLYPSPWLPDRWESEDIHFFVTKEQETAELSIKPYSPFVTLKFGGDSKGKGVMGANQSPLGIHTPNSSSTHVPDATVRNERLFCLGVVLLELGYTKPWDILRSSITATLPSNQKSDYAAAKRLARDLVPHMGMKYVRIVLQCIGCDFGLGETELNDEGLQNKFVNDIIEVLQALGEGLATI